MINNSIPYIMFKIKGIVPNIIIIERKKDYWYHFTIDKYNAYINRKKDGWEFDLVDPDERFYVNHKEASDLPDKIQLDEVLLTLVNWYKIILMEEK